jgi:hypothetical protein
VTLMTTTIDQDEPPFAGSTLADLEAERAAREDQLADMREAYPGSRAARVLENYLAELAEEIRARGQIGA